MFCSRRKRNTSCLLMPLMEGGEKEEGAELRRDTLGSLSPPLPLALAQWLRPLRLFHFGTGEADVSPGGLTLLWVLGALGLREWEGLTRWA